MKLFFNPFLVSLIALLADSKSNASIIWKAGNNDNLALTSSWWTSETGSTNPVSIGTADTLRLGGSGQGTSRTLSLGGNLSIGALRLDNNTGTPNYNAAISTGNTLTLNGNNDYTSGAVQGIVLNSASGGTLTIDADIIVAASQRWVASRTLNINGNVNLGANTLTLWTAAATTTIAGVISGTGGLTRDNSAGGISLLTGANTYSGTTRIDMGILRVTGSGALGGTAGGSNDAGNIVFGTSSSNATLEFESSSNLGVASQIRFRNTGGTSGAGGTLRYIGTTAQSVGKTLQCDSSIGIRLESNSVGGSLTFNGAFSQSNRPLYLGGTGTGDNTLATAFTGTGGMTKTGAGTWILSGNNTYAGPTTVQTGTLRVNGTNSGAGAVNVSSGATLGGTGSIAGAVNVTGTLAPGASIESLGTGNLAFSAGSTLAYELNSTALNGDLLDSTGTLDIASGTILTLTDLAAGALANGSKLTLISYFGGWVNTELFTYLGSTLADDSVITLGTNQWIFNYNDTSGGSNFAADQTGATGFVTMTVVPEPAAALLGGLGFLILLRRRRNGMRA